jgi:hypothetical protein
MVADTLDDLARAAASLVPARPVVQTLTAAHPLLRVQAEFVVRGVRRISDEVARPGGSEILLRNASYEILDLAEQLQHLGTSARRYGGMREHPGGRRSPPRARPGQLASRRRAALSVAAAWPPEI